MNMLDYAIKQAAVDLDVTVSDRQVEQAAEFIHSLFKWNQVYNFTALKTKEEMVSRHWRDSLTVAHHVVGARVLDVGTGPGLPGIPLSILYTNKTFCLLDSNQKRQLFLEHLLHQLKLSHVFLHCGRVESYDPEDKFDCIIARAFKPLPEMLKLTKHLLNDGGLILAMKGNLEKQELEGSHCEGWHMEVVPLPKAEQGQARNLIKIKKAI